MGGSMDSTTINREKTSLHEHRMRSLINPYAAKARPVLARNNRSERRQNLQEPSIPPKITIEMAKGFTFCMVKAVMNGRADEMPTLQAIAAENK
jgi:hypothetical protein